MNSPFWTCWISILKEHNHLQLKCIAGRSGLSRKLTTTKISRPGLPLSGFFDEFSHESIQVFGRGEQQYVKKLEDLQTLETIERLFSYPIPTCVFCDGGLPSKQVIDIAERSGCSILQTALGSADFSRGLYQMLDEIFADTITIHGVLVEVYGIGVLITGDSGVGKSETALELIERGHRLISDDTVKLRNISDTYPSAAARILFWPTIWKSGLGNPQSSQSVGVGSIRDKKQVQLLVRLEEWDSNKNYERVGEELTETLLGITVPKLEIPVKPGRNVPIIIETAARNERLKKLGYYSAKEFDQSVLKWLESESARNLYYSNEETF